MEKPILVLASTFPRWKNDSTPPFVLNLCRSVNRQCVVLVPHDSRAKFKENIANMQIHRFAYWWPYSSQKLCYGGGILPNFKSSFLAKMQLPFLFLNEYVWARKLLRKNTFSLVHAHWLLPQGFIASLLKGRYRFPLVVSIHGTDLFGLKGFISSKIQRYVLKKATQITVNSSATKNELLRRFSFAKSKVHVIPMGVDTSLFKKKQHHKIEKLLFVGRLSEQKGLQYLIPSISLLENKEIKLVVIGEGPYKKELERIAEQHNVRDRIIFMGAKSQQDISKLHANSIFVLPSISSKEGTEALGVSLLEAMSSACPVIASKSGGIVDAVRNKENGLLVEERSSIQLAKVIDYLLENKASARKLGEHAALSIETHYSCEAVGKKFEKLYDELT